MLDKEKILCFDAAKQKNNSIEDITIETEELIIGMIGAVGAGVTTSAKIIKGLLENDYNYDVQIIRARDLISENADKVGEKFLRAAPSDEIVKYQQIGTALRKHFGNNYLAAKAIELISMEREAPYLLENGEKAGAIPAASIPRRKATIIDSLKHREETELLTSVYGQAYWQFTVFAPEDIRKKRLESLDVHPDKISSIFTTDENAPDDHGQQVSKAAFLSDFFLRNDSTDLGSPTSSISRYLEIIFNIRVHTPNRDEAGMYAAVSAASRSACLSRQVGAALYSKEGELIGVGWNDVPKIAGGLYTSDDFPEDHRCYNWSGGICHNDSMKEELYVQIFEKLMGAEVLTSSASFEKIRELISSTAVKSLIEYSRSIHAEMEAIVSAGRSGKSGMVGGTLYTTTFPCHNCARHIVAAGIATVYYIEPYSKSLALKLHGDSIATDTQDMKKVHFLQYDGVGPRSIRRLFQHQIDRKSNGKALTIPKVHARPVLPPPTEGFTEHERRVIKRVVNAEKADGEM